MSNYEFYKDGSKKAKEIELSIPHTRVQPLEGQKNITVSVQEDFDSSENPNSWIWLSFTDENETCFMLTREEAARLRDRLNFCVELEYPSGCFDSESEGV